MAKKYVKSYSNYILRSNPSPTENGYVYENDLLTVGQGSRIVNGKIVTTTDGGFTFVVNATSDEKKIYNNNGWSEKSFTLGDLTLTENDLNTNTVKNKTVVNKKKYVDIKKSYSNLTKYCYFGSVNAMLNASVSNIINNFPAGLHIKTRDNVDVTVDGRIITIPISDIENKLNIDLFNYYSDDRVNLNYDLRIFASSYSDFEIVNGNEEFVGNIINFTGYTTADTNSVKFELSENLIQTTGDTYTIRPIQGKREEFFNTLDDFEKVILNNDTSPKYKSTFIIPIETERGIVFETKTFIWPSSDGYNIDIDSSDYISFITQLIDITNFIDENFSDNIYRMLTHESIKALDSTYERIIDEERLDEIVIGGTKVQNILRLYGRSYDEIKKHIEGISFANTVTYSGDDNIPIEYLSTKLDTSGWDILTLSSVIDSNERTSDNLFNGIKKQYTLDDVNNELMKRIVINSKDIFRTKGTKKSIRRMFGLLGFEDNWYEIREYIQLIDNLITNPNHLKTIAALNYNIYPEETAFSDSIEPFVYSYDQNLFDNTNVGVFVKCPICDSEDYFVSGETYGEYNTATCIKCKAVFNITGNTVGYPRPLINSTQYYFQQKGNWYRETGGSHINLDGSINYVNEVTSGNNPHIGRLESDSFGYDNGYDYVDQFTDFFKRFHRNASERGVIDISGYTTYNDSYRRFTTYTKKSYNEKIQNRGDRRDGDLVLNLKNMVIGINGGNVLRSFLTRYENEPQIEFTNVNTGKTVNASEKRYIIVTNETAYITTLTITDLTTDGIKIISNRINNKDIIIKYGLEQIGVVKPGIDRIVKFDDDNNVIIIDYNGEDEYELLRAIALPYIEQLIPSTSIFDFVLIERNKPKWTLVDKYLYRDPRTGIYDGDTIIVYQNTNYYDDESEGYIGTGLVEEIEENFGTGFTKYKEITKTAIMLSESSNYLVFENGNYILSEDIRNKGFDNIYFFKGRLPSDEFNVEPEWIIDNNII